jgi:hypothetical protein
VEYIDYFKKREERKKEYEHYYENIILKKGQRDMEKDPPEFPAPEPAK